MATCPKCRRKYGDEVEHCPRDGEALLSDEAFASVDSDLEPAEEVGEYEIVEKIGTGGFGTVYRARQPLIGKEVAIKLLNRGYSSNPQMVSRFIEEARAVNQIRHRNIIDIFSFGMHEDKRQYFVMEFLAGQPFDEYLSDRERLSPEEAIPILRQIAKALDAAHAAGIAHRDLKPENVFLTYDDDGQPFPKLLDFGIAKLLGGSRRSGHKTATGQPIGTPYYMSPEQCLGSGVDHRADIYSFGVMCHEVLTGQLLFDAPEMMNVLVMQMSRAPPAMSSVCPELPPQLDAPVLHMLAKQPADRPDSVQAGLEALAQAAQEAGFAVQVARIRRGGITTPGEEHRPVVAAGAKLTPTEQALMGGAPTVADGPQARVRSATPSPSTLSAADIEPMAPTQRAPGPRRGKLVGLALAAGVVVGALVVVLFARGSGDGASGDEAQLGPDATTASVQSAASTDESDPSEPAPTASDAPAAEAAPARVELTIESTPKQVDVYRGDERLGSAPGPINLEQSDEPVELRFEAPGYLPKTRTVTPSKDGFVSVELVRAAQRPTVSPPTATAEPAGTEQPKPGKDELSF